MELREGLTVEDSFLDEFAVRHGIHRLALYGSALRPDFGPASDVDLLVEFQPGRTPDLLHLAQMELELEAAVTRRRLIPPSTAWSVWPQPVQLSPANRGANLPSPADRRSRIPDALAEIGGQGSLRVFVAAC